MIWIYCIGTFLAGAALGATLALRNVTVSSSAAHGITITARTASEAAELMGALQQMGSNALQQAVLARGAQQSEKTQPRAM